MLTCDCTLMVVCSGSWWRERELKRAWCKFAANTRPLWTSWITMGMILMIHYRVMIRTYHTIYKIEYDPYMQKTCDVAEKAILAKKKLRKKCVNCDKM